MRWDRKAARVARGDGLLLKKETSPRKTWGEELKHLLTPSPATIAQFIQNALSSIQSHEEDLLDLHSAPLDAGVEVQILDVGQAEDQGVCGNLSQASKRKPGTKQVSLSFPPSEPPYQANQVQSEVLDNQLVGINRRSHQENDSQKSKDPGQSARKGSVLKTSKALGVRQHKDAKLSPLSMKKA